MTITDKKIIDFTTEEKIDFMNEFLSLYEERPVQNNQGGMKIPHLFNLYLVLKKLNPKLIVESGIWHGQGTWFMEKVCPDAKIISFDIELSLRSFISDKVEYNQHDITEYDWVDFFEKNSEYTPENTLLFLDDHVNFDTRVDFISNLSFKYVINEDNYPPNQGDCITPKKILESDKYVIDRAGNRQWHIFDDGVKSSLENAIIHYEELSPIYKIDVTRWGDSGDNYKTPEPHFEFNYFNDDKIINELLDYTWICLMEFTSD